MKSYEEMSDSVLEKVRVQRAVQRRNRRMVLCAASVCCIVLAVSVAANNLKPETPPVQIEKPTFVEKPAVDLPISPTEAVNDQQDTERISIWCASSSGSAEVLRENVSIPYKSELRVRNVSGMSEEERAQVLDEENTYVQQIREKFEQNAGYGRYCRENVIVTRISVGEFSLAFADIESIDRIQVSVTESGYIFYPRFAGIRYKELDENGCTVEVDGDKLRKGLEMLETDKFQMVWHFNPSVAELLNENPEMALAQLSDQITITVEYTDGTVETKTVVMQVCDDGRIMACLLDGTVPEQVPG